MVVTTVIPTIGRATLYTRAIPSVLAQTVADWRCIIVGDGVDIAPPDDARFTVLRVEASEQTWHVGGAHAFNHGLDHVTSEWFSYLADDDEYMPRHHAALLGAVGKADVAYGKSRTPGRIGEYGERWPPDPYDIVQGSYIMRTATGMRAAESVVKSTWDYAWWLEAVARLTFVQVNELVHKYHPAPENAHLHGASC